MRSEGVPQCGHGLVNRCEQTSTNTVEVSSPTVRSSNPSGSPSNAESSMAFSHRWGQRQPTCQRLTIPYLWQSASTKCEREPKVKTAFGLNYVKEARDVAGYDATPSTWPGVG